MPTTITIPATGTGDPAGSHQHLIPRQLIVSGAPTTINKVTVTLNHFNHTFPDDVDVLLRFAHRSQDDHHV